MIFASSRCVVVHHIEPLEARIAPAFAAALDLAKLTGANGFKIPGLANEDFAGASVGAAGDVNGDGIGDLIVGVTGSGPDGASTGAAFVVFGRVGGFGAKFNLATLTGANGFKIQGEADFDFAGVSVGPAGDVNGDQVDDLIVGASAADPQGPSSGASYVVFGSKTGFPATLNLSALTGSNGFKIRGEAANDGSGFSVRGAGDVNGDHVDDVIIGAQGADANGTDSGAAYVVFGHTGVFATPLTLSASMGANGFKILGEAPGGMAGASVSGAGDLNGDHVADVIIGAPLVDANGTDSGASYVVFGHTGTFGGTLSLAGLTAAEGFKIPGEVAGDQAGNSVSGAGDVNGDGIADVLLGARLADPHGISSGAAYVIFGHTGTFGTTLNLTSLTGGNGFKIQGEMGDVGELLGDSVSGAGDVNGDGFADVILGADENNTHGNGSGASYVVFGRANGANGFGATLEVSTLNGKNGFKLLGEALGDHSGGSVSGAGDVNGDGIADLIIGAYGNTAATEAGAAYVIFGAGPVTLGAKGKTATFTDPEGDLVTVKTSTGAFVLGDFKVVPEDAGVQFQRLNLSAHAADFAGAAISISAKKAKGGTGDGLADVDFIDAHGLDLGAVSVSGRLERIDAGDDALDAHGKPIAALQSLTVGSLGEAPLITGNAADYHSHIVGPLGALTVKGNVLDAFVEVTGVNGMIGKISIDGNLDGRGGGTDAGLIEASAGIGAVTVKGSIIGGGEHSGIRSGGTIGKVAITGDLTSAVPAKPVTISALGRIGATKTSEAVAIAGVTVKTNVLNARILAGYDVGLVARNPDAGIGAISVSKNWGASSVAAGVKDATGDGFGRNDTLIPGGDATPDIPARIASITIKGSAKGSDSPGTDFFGITAEQIGLLTIGGVRKLLVPGSHDLLLDATNKDFHRVDLASGSAAPDNDNFAEARVIDSDSATDASNNSFATAEPGEDVHTDIIYEGKSIWWKWTASHAGAVTVDTLGSAFDTLLAVYTGDSIAHLALVSSNDDADPDVIKQSEVHFTAVAGTTYSFLVDAFTGAPLNGGSVIFSLSAA
ncbi:MAG: hypothetical protein QOE70_2986 [Chthoniobacter sp.]|jgi:hypothetical protein|nr:hypothetical protein [Chthoniobacter sp.]